MAALHGEISNERGSKCSRLAHKEVHSHISTWDVAIDCWLDKEGKGRCEVSEHKSKEVVGSFDVEHGRVYNHMGGYEMRPKVSELRRESVSNYEKFHARDTSHDDEPYQDLHYIERLGR